MTEVATMTVKDGDKSAQSLSMLMSSTIESPWYSNSLDPQITIDFDEQVTILDVVLKPAFVIAEDQSDSMNSSSLINVNSVFYTRPENVTFNTMTVNRGNRSDNLKASLKNIR